MIARLEVDLGAIRRNVAALGALAAPARYAAVVKANAYGHGLVDVARALAPDVASFCVYRIDEAVALRDAGIATPVLVLGPIEACDLDVAIRARAAIALWSTGAFARDLARAARDVGTRAIVHAKIDTGVTRLGLDAAAAPAGLERYAADDAFDVRGVFTHLAAAEELESSFTHEQLARFDAATAPSRARFRARGVTYHAAASAAAMLYPHARLDLIRAGIATYGIWPSEATRASVARTLALEPALAWRTALVVVRDIDAGRSVGYGCSFVASRPSRIGVLPIGYAEGLPRALSNAGAALVRGTRVPFVGRVCMNMAFVDVTDVPSAATGDAVTLIGSDGAETIGANDLATCAGTIGYELVARLPASVPRIYAGRDANVAIASATSIVRS
ncbi:MAG: alanine racemase [Vulcanimicrobiaceae bacterium]